MNCPHCEKELPSAECPHCQAQAPEGSVYCNHCGGIMEIPKPVKGGNDWDNRILCSDGSCIGIIGPDGKCKECGKPYRPGAELEDDEPEEAAEEAEETVEATEKAEAPADKD